MQFSPHIQAISVFSVLEDGQYEPDTESAYSGKFKNWLGDPGIEEVYLDRPGAAERLDSLIARVRSLVNQSEAAA